MSIERRGILEQSFVLTGETKKAKRSIVYFCDSGETLADVMKSPEFPVLGEVFSEIPGTYCSEILLKPENEGRKNKILVECTYSTVSGMADGEDSVDYGKPFFFKVFPVETKVPFLYSYDETDSEGRPVHPVCSTAGEFFDLETTAITMLARFSYYARSFNPEWILDYTDSTNQNEIKVCGILIRSGRGLLRSLSAERAMINGKPEIRVNVELEINPEGFLRYVPNRGYFCWDGNSYSRVCMGVSKLTNDTVYASVVQMLAERKEDSPIMPVDEPVWLDSTGNIDSAQRATKNAALLAFREKKSMDWSVLSLPSGQPW